MAQTPLDCGVPVSRELSPEDVHRYSFRVAQGDGVAVDLVDISDPAGAPMAYRFLGPSGGVIDEACESDRFFGFDIAGLTAGMHVLEVFLCDDAPTIRYSVTLSSITSRFNGGPNCGRRVDCEPGHSTGTFPDQDPSPVTAFGGVDAYQVEVLATGRVTFSAIDVSGEIGLLEMRLYAPNGEQRQGTCDGVIEDVVEPGIHTLIVGNCFGVDTGTYRLVFDSADCPADVSNDDCADAVTVSEASFIDVQNTSAATADAGGPAPTCGDGTRGKSVWYDFTPTRAGTIFAGTLGSTYDTVLSTYTGSCGALHEAPGGCSDDAVGSQSKIAVAAAAGTTYSFMIGDYDDAGGTLAFALSFVEGTAAPTPTPTPSTGDCCAEHGSVGCEQRTCESCVCADDSFCCLEIWDDDCARTARRECAADCLCASGPTPTATPGPCPADCDSDGLLGVNDLVQGARIALGDVPLSTCPAFDADADREVRVDEIVRAIRAALGGCGT